MNTITKFAAPEKGQLYFRSVFMITCKPIGRVVSHLHQCYLSVLVEALVACLVEHLDVDVDVDGICDSLTILPRHRKQQ